MKKKILSVIALSAIMATASGCTPLNLNSDELMHPPKTSVDEQRIMELISKTSGDNYTLKYPENGTNRSAIIMKDIDGDSQDEAVAFYQTSTLSETTLHMLVMYEDAEGWKSAGDTKTKNEGIDRIEFADITGDGNLEIILGYKTFTSNTNQLNIFTYNGETATKLDTAFTYTNFIIDNFSMGEQSEILTITLQSDKLSTASLLSCKSDKNSIANISSVAIDPGITSIESIISGKLNADLTCGFIDGTFSTDKLCSQIVFYDINKNTLVNGLYSETVATPNPTIRDGKTYSMDFDKNGTVEIPTLSKMPLKKDENTELVASTVVWNSFDITGNTLVPLATMIVNYNASYYFRLEDNRVNNVTARINSEDNSMTVFNWNGTEATEKLFTIKVYSSQDYSTTGKNDGYSLIKENGAKAYCYKIENTDSEQKYTDEEIVKAFSLFSEYEQN